VWQKRVHGKQTIAGKETGGVESIEVLNKMNSINTNIFFPEVVNLQWLTTFFYTIAFNL
jgi:hypothetical protein